MDTEKLHYGWTVLAVGTLAVFSALGLARFGYTMVLPAMQAELGLNNAQAGLLAAFNMAGYLLFVILGGALSTRYGARLVIVAGLAAAGLAMIGTGLADRFLTVALWRGLTGVASGGANIAVMGLLPAWFSTRRRGMASGVAVGGSSLALIFTGQFVPWIGALEGTGGWRTCWILFGALTLLVAVTAGVVLRNRPGEIGLDAIGQAPSAPAAAAPGAVRWRVIGLSAPAWALGLIYSAFGFSYIIYMTFFFKFLIQDGGYTPVAAGQLFMTMGWVSLFCGVLWGTLSDHIGRRLALMMVFLIQAAAYGLFAAGTSPAWFTGSAVLFGLSAWSIPAIMGAACGDLYGPRLAPAVLGFVTHFMGIGQVLGPFVGGLVADSAGGFVPAFRLAAAVALSGAAGSLLLLKGR